MPTPPLIQVRDLTRRIGEHGRVILDRVNLTIGAGERIGLVGRSGSGKSSLMRAIARLDPCDAGEIRCRDQLVCDDEVPGYRRRVIYLSQRPAFADTSVRENLVLPFRFAAAEENFDPSRIEHWLTRFSIPDTCMDQPVDSLSGGEQQIVALIRAISLMPQVLLLDEPTASLDAASTAQFERLVDDWYDESDDEPCERSFVWTSHDDDQVMRMASRMLEMRDGTLREVEHV